MNSNIIELHGQSFYWDSSPGKPSLPIPTPGIIKQVGEFHICMFPDGARWVSWADRRDSSLITWAPGDLWNFHDHKGQEYAGTPSEAVVKAVESTVAAKLKKPDTSYSGHKTYQALLDLQNRTVEALGLSEQRFGGQENNRAIEKQEAAKKLTLADISESKKIAESCNELPFTLETLKERVTPASSAVVDAETGDLIPRELDGFVIFQRAKDGYVNATAMCKAVGKRTQHYLDNQQTKDYLAAQESKAGIPASLLVEVIKGGIPGEMGTWVHPRIVVDLARWCAPKFAVVVDEWVQEWLNTGKKPELAFDLSNPESLLRHLQQASTLALEARESLRLEQQARVSVTEEKEQIEEALVQVITTASETAGFMTIMDYAKDREKFLGYGQNDLCLLLRLLGIFFYRKFEYIKGRTADRNHVNGKWIANNVFVYRKDEIEVTPRSDKKAAAKVAATLALPESPADCYNEKDLINVLTKSIRVVGSKAHVLDNELFTDPLTLLSRRCQAELKPRKRHPLRGISDRWLIWDSPDISEAAQLAKHSLRILGEDKWTKAIRLWKTEVAGVTQSWTCWAFSPGGKQVIVTRPTESESLDALAVEMKKTP